MIYKHRFIYLFAIVLLISTISQSLLTSKMSKKKFSKITQQDTLKSTTAPVVQTSCNRRDFSEKYNYTDIVATGYLKVGKGNSALGFTFYGRQGVKSLVDLKNYPTILWLNGGPGSSSQIGNLQELGPLQLIRDGDLKIVKNNYTWATKYNILFVDQPVGTGLSYADTTSGQKPFVKSMEEVGEDFYKALYELYNGKGCFSPVNFNISPSNPLVIFGQSYGGKYAPAIALTIVQRKQTGGFLTGLRGVAIGDGFTDPYGILSQVGTFSYHLSLIDFQQRMKLQKILLNASRHSFNSEYNALRLDFDNALDYIVEKAGNINVYNIQLDGDYQQLLQPYFWDQSIYSQLYQFNPEIVYDSQSEMVYTNLNEDFMKPEVNRVQILLAKGIPVLVYNGQDDLIVQNPGTMKWVDRLHHTYAHQFRTALFQPWKIEGKVVGSRKKAGLLQLRIVNNAGHLVPQDRPKQSLDMAISFVEGCLRP